MNAFDLLKLELDELPTSGDLLSVIYYFKLIEQTLICLSLILSGVTVPGELIF